MKIILLKDLHKVGKKYEVVTVADGYALNSLIPTRVAEIATAKTVEKYTKLKEVESAARLLREEELVKELGSIAQKEFTIEAKANEQGHLFASVHKEEVGTVIGVDPMYITISTPIKEVGEHTVSVTVKDVTKEIKITVVAK
ncbi:MAG: 50S ribosomal protein L9 [Patescibacteria group bacterium]